LKSRFLIVLVLGIAASMFALPLSAHHGNAAYDVTKQATLKGTVTEWFWGNPHCLIQFDVADASGQSVRWSAETENPATMTHMGWSRFSFKPGDPITITVFPVKNGKPIGRIVNVVTANGQKLPGRILPVVDTSKREDDPHS
jgi:hypothetical protein